MIIKPFLDIRKIKFSKGMYWWTIPKKIKGVILEKSNLVIPPYRMDVDDYVINYTLPSTDRMMKILKKKNPVFKTMLDHSEIYIYSDFISEKTPHQLIDDQFDSVYFSTIEPIKRVWYFDLI